MVELGPVRVCLVCAGNICRSPMAEIVLRAKLAAAGMADAVVVDSAGTGGWHVGHGASHGALDALSRRGYVSRHAARLFDPAWFAERDLILALDANNAHDLRRLAPDSGSRAKVHMLGSYVEPDRSARAATGKPSIREEQNWSVPDPYGGTDRDFDHALDLIEAACAGLVAALVAGDIV